jgi:hypothetical protein
MERGTFEEFVKSWGEARENVAKAFASMREVLERLGTELGEIQTRLQPVLDSVDGTLEKLKPHLESKKSPPEDTGASGASGRQAP